ncbi:hypothetical protein IU447_06075 [Nocardia farcinica]|uniref:dimethylamine monooxygenase subunit DmmA family protein n=1 Tax=Nocardia farcinica TaxID=37329 RepID=UPI000A375E7A|nr:dimethylamine monooxygenase subunit DmmA family protein [Nocardia farcinica]MBF6359682.1 hypothetical protein [Nocardia farcinica]
MSTTDITRPVGTVPRWTAGDPAELPVATAATTYVVVATDPAALADARGFADRVTRAERTPARDGRQPAILVDGTDDGRLTEVLALARVGWRFAVIGTEPGLSRCRAAILAAGAIESEIVTAGPADGGARDLYCAHCRTTSRTDAAVGAETRCAACGVPLTVYHHFSPRLHAYLGYHPHAEEL